MEKTNKHDKRGLKPFFLNSNLWVIQIPIVLLSISVVPASVACTRKMFDMCVLPNHMALLDH